MSDPVQTQPQTTNVALTDQTPLESTQALSSTAPSLDPSQPIQIPNDTTSEAKATDGPSQSDQSPAPTATQDTRISQLAEAFKINTDKPNFPINTMRLFYLLLVDSYTQSDQTALEMTNQAIPKISALLDTVEAAPKLNDKILQSLKPATQELSDVIKIDQTASVSRITTQVYPLQRQLLISFQQLLSQDKLEASELDTLLTIRAMDADIYSSVISDIISQHKELTLEERIEIFSVINHTLQLNDIVDAVIYAKQDMEAGSATLINIIQKVITSADEIDVLIDGLKTRLIISENTPATILEFQEKLYGVITSKTKT